MAVFDRVPCNISPRGRTVRLIVGIVFLLVSLTDNVGFGGVFVQALVGLVGAGLVVSAWLWFCPVSFLMERESDIDGD